MPLGRARAGWNHDYRGGVLLFAGNVGGHLAPGQPRVQGSLNVRDVGALRARSESGSRPASSGAPRPANPVNEILRDLR